MRVGEELGGDGDVTKEAARVIQLQIGCIKYATMLVLFDAFPFP